MTSSSSSWIILLMSSTRHLADDFQMGQMIFISNNIDLHFALILVFTSPPHRRMNGHCRCKGSNLASWNTGEVNNRFHKRLYSYRRGIPPNFKCVWLQMKLKSSLIISARFLVSFVAIHSTQNNAKVRKPNGLLYSSH